MRILLLGEYSNVHATLARGLRALGHEVTVASNGDFWKDYPRDIDLARKPGRLGGMALMAKVYAALPRMTGYDVVQIINPMFVELKAERIFPIYRWLRRHNRRVVLCAFGMDYYWVNECVTRKHLRYSDFNIGGVLRRTPDSDRERRDWIGTAKERLNRMIAADCDHIITGLYEYHSCYQPLFPDKTTFIPFPIEVPARPVDIVPCDKVRIFIGINRERSAYKGTDIMLAAARRIERDYPGRVELRVAESVPFAQYERMVEGSDIILDQLYSYTPSMNPLMAMSKGLVCVGGGEPENYDILGETELHPIINVQPTEASVYHELEQLVLHPDRLPQLRRDSRAYVLRHHEYRHVAQAYERVFLELGIRD